jgi:hypothetical protein
MMILSALGSHLMSGEMLFERYGRMNFFTIVVVRVWKDVGFGHWIQLSLFIDLVILYLQFILLSNMAIFKVLVRGFMRIAESSIEEILMLLQMINFVIN